jgi:nucleoside-triphosphatase THEP1
MLNDEFSPYDKIVELENAIKHHVQLINTVLNNEKQFITAINKASDRIDELEMRILKLEMTLTDLEEEPNEVTRKKR